MGSVLSHCIEPNRFPKNSFDYDAINSNQDQALQFMSIREFNPIIKSCNALSMKGLWKKDKVNQDRILIYFEKKTKSLLFGVLDGHGKDGHLVAEYIRDSYLEFMLRCDLLEQYPCDAMTLCLKQAEDKMVEEKLFDYYHSGCTSLMGVIQGSTLYTINVGDSRSFYQFCDPVDKRIKVIPVAAVHNPNDVVETRRIESFGGFVQSYTYGDSLSVSRVYTDCLHAEGGLAMSRSIGDVHFQKYGVISEPDIYTTSLHDNVVAILFGSDGLTTCFNPEYCFARIKADPNPLEGLRCLIQDVYRESYAASKGTYVDDMSGVFIEINHRVS